MSREGADSPALQAIYAEVEEAQLAHLPQRPPVHVAFQDLTYTVPLGRKSSKLILRSLSGEFRSGQLTAILGPSGAGKSTLLNVLAAYRCIGASGTVYTNGHPRDIRQFRKLSCYIMQQDLIQPRLTVHESMLMAADLKLGDDLSTQHKLVVVDEILQLLRLTKAAHTTTARLSGGEKKRLSIALELLNNPPVIFLDEPTTGLDDLSSSQCVALLKRIARGGRTVVCSVHTPSARLFSAFDHVYVVAGGQCAYAGDPASVVPFLRTSTGLVCPLHYNPADFVIEASSGEYTSAAARGGAGSAHGHVERMVAAMDNGGAGTWRVCPSPSSAPLTDPSAPPAHSFKYRSTAWQQFVVLLRRMMLQTVRDKNYLWLRISMHIFLGLIIGSLFLQMGNDASKTIFNFGYCYSCLIALLYVPMLPVLLSFPSEVQLLKREYFNRWYGLKPYYAALLVARVPATLCFSLVFLALTYLMTGQPLELARISMFFTVALTVALIAEAMGIVISSTFNIVNSVFTGPAASVPLMLLAVYGMGAGEASADVPLFWRLAMHLSFLRYGLEGLVAAVYGGQRPNMECPPSNDYCEYRNASYFMRMMGMSDASYVTSMSMLLVMLVVFNAAGYYLLRQRVSPSRTFKALKYIGRFVKSHISLAPH